MSSDELSTRQVPIEIIEAILANVASDTSPDSKAALYACSMASSEMAYCTRPHIFRKVTFDCKRCINTSTRCQRFLEIVATNPNIPIYIKECRINDYEITSYKLVFLADPLFPSVLDALKNVQRFELTFDSSRYALVRGDPPQFYWDYLEKNQKYAVHSFFSNAQFTHLHLGKVDFPLEFAEYILRFKYVELDSCSFRRNVVDFSDFRTLSTQATRLEKLTVSYTNAEPVFNAISRTGHRLKELIIPVPGTSCYWKYIRWTIRRIQLSGIDILSFKILVKLSNSDIVEMLSRVPEDNVISQISFMLDFSDHWMNNVFMESIVYWINEHHLESSEVRKWNTVDTKLAEAKFKTLKKVAVYPIGLTIDIEPWLIQLLSKWFPRMHERGIIDVVA